MADTKLGTETEKVDPAKRVLMFSFNGGPGSASIWLHRGALGPKRVVTKANGDSLPPPDESAENDYAWLDETDLGLLEPVSTVYSRGDGRRPEAVLRVQRGGRFGRRFHPPLHDAQPALVVAEISRRRKRRHAARGGAERRFAGPRRALPERHGAGLLDHEFRDGVVHAGQRSAGYVGSADLPGGRVYHKKLGGARAAADLRTALTAAKKFVQDR